MAQIDFLTYSSVVFFVYFAFWLYFVCCVAAVTDVYRSMYYRFFLNYSTLLPVYASFVSVANRNA